MGCLHLTNETKYITNINRIILSILKLKISVRVIIIMYTYILGRCRQILNINLAYFIEFKTRRNQ